MDPVSKKCVRLSGLLVAFSAAMGCGGGAGQPTAAVSGTATAGAESPSGAQHDAQAGSSAQGDETWGRYIKVYKGGQGVTLTFLPSRDKRRALVRFDGVESDVDKQVIQCEMRESGYKKSDCFAAVSGTEEWHLLRFQGSSWGSWQQLIAWIPGVDDQLSFYYDEEATEKAERDDLIKGGS